MLNFIERNKLYLDNHDCQTSNKFFLYGDNVDEIGFSLLKIGKVHQAGTLALLKDYFNNSKEEAMQVDIVFICIDQEEKYLNQCLQLFKKHTRPNCHFVGITAGSVELQVQKALKLGLKDLYHINDDPFHIVKRIDFIKNLDDQFLENESENVNMLDASISLRKRVFDIVFSSLVLLIFSPLMVLIAILIKIESRGPVFFVSPRAGTGFKIFNFYKFRSMKIGSDSKLHELLKYNQYGQDAEVSSFIKLRNDPRVTRVGWLLRKTSLDELPQLINVIKGDMSVVGNRPLPLYEAESLTRDEIVKRFFAPAGITGLWQISKRGKKEMSVEERLALDVSYVDHRSAWFDLKIIWKTIPAMIQEESV